MKRSEKKKLEDKADSLWSDLVIARDGKCRSCGAKNNLSAHHIRVRQHKATKYDIDNGLCLDWKCHSLQKYRPQAFHDLVIDIIGQTAYDELRERSEVNIQDKYGMCYGIRFLRFIIERLKSD